MWMHNRCPRCLCKEAGNEVHTTHAHYKYFIGILVDPASLCQADGRHLFSPWMWVQSCRFWWPYLVLAFIDVSRFLLVFLGSSCDSVSLCFLVLYTYDVRTFGCHWVFPMFAVCIFGSSSYIYSHKALVCPSLITIPPR